MSKRRTPRHDAEPPTLDGRPSARRDAAPPELSGSGSAPQGADGSRGGEIPPADDGSLPKIARTQRGRRPKQPVDGAFDAGEPITGAPGRRSRKRRPAPPTPPRAAQDGQLWGIARIAMFGLAGLVVLGAVAAGALYAFLPTDLVRDRLVQEVKAQTGRDLVISGGTSVSLWPRIAVSLGGVKLGNPAAFGGGTLLTAERVEAAVRLRPLLSGDVQVAHVTLRRPVVDLIVDPQGRRNWDFASLLGPTSAPSWPIGRLAQATPSASPNLPTPGLPRDVVDFVKGSSRDKAAGARMIVPEKISVSDGTVRYRDQARGVAEEVRSLNVDARMTTGDAPLDALATLVWRGETVTVNTQLAPMQALVDKRPAKLTLKLQAAPLTLDADGSLALVDGADFEGQVRARAGSVDRLASWSGRLLPVSVPGSLDVTTRLKLAGPVTALADATIALDRLNATGGLTIDTRGVRPRLTGKIRMAELDLNAMQAIAETAPPVAPTAAPARPAASAPAGGATPQSIEDLLKAQQGAGGAQQAPQVRGYVRRKGWSDDAIRLEALSSVDADVQLGFGLIKWKDVLTGAGQVTVQLKDGAGRFTLDDLLLYEGRAKGVVTLDGTGGVAAVGTNVTAEGVSILPLLSAASGFDWLRGRARIALAVAGQGKSEREIVSTLNGRAEITMGDGAIVGINVGQMLRGVMQGRVGNFERVPSEKTDFSELSGTLQIKNGVGQNRDFRMVSPVAQATGAGTIDLPAETIDYVLKPKVVSVPGGQDGGINLAGLEVPLRIKGPLDKPVVTPELGGLLKDPQGAVKAVQDALKTPQGRELEQTVRGVLAGDDAAKAKAKSLLDQFLKR